MLDLERLIHEAHETAVSKGWWDGPERNAGDQFANFHAEIAEAWEEYRKHGMWNCHLYGISPHGAMTQIELGDGQKPEGIAAEFADVLIRIFDTCAKYNIPLAHHRATEAGFA